MTETLERELRAALAECAENLPVAAVVERLEQVDYHTQTPSRSRWLPFRPAVGAAAAALAAAIAAMVVLLWSSSAPVAYAGWTPTPTTPTTAAVAAVTAACNRNHIPAMGQLLLTDARGKYTAAIYVSDGFARDCISDGSSNATSGGGEALRFLATPAPDQIEHPVGGSAQAPGFGEANQGAPLPPQFRQALQDAPSARVRARMNAAFRRLLGQDVESNVYGMAGSDIATVTFVFTAGVTVDATVQNGWYFAWWPSFDQPTSVQVTTTTGKTTTSQLGVPPCKPHTTGCVFSGLSQLALNTPLRR